MFSVKVNIYSEVGEGEIDIDSLVTCVFYTNLI